MKKIIKIKKVSELSSYVIAEEGWSKMRSSFNSIVERFEGYSLRIENSNKSLAETIFQLAESEKLINNLKLENEMLKLKLIELGYE